MIKLFLKLGVRTVFKPDKKDNFLILVGLNVGNHIGCSNIINIYNYYISVFLIYVWFFFFDLVFCYFL